MITNTRLVNFKCFADQGFSLRPLTVLSGVNGTGKSSAIQSLLLLRQSYEQKLLPKLGLALNGAHVTMGTAKDAMWRNAEDETIRFELDFEHGETAKWLFEYDALSDVLKVKESEVSEAFYEQSLFGKGFQHLGAERIGPRTSFSMADYTVRQWRQLGSRGEFTAHFLSVYGRETVTLPATIHADAGSESLHSQVESWLGSVSPGVRLDITPHPSMDLVHMQYAFVEGRMVSDPYRPTNVGFGLTYTLPVIVATLAASEGGLLLFENPEAHLHAKGQIRLAELFARAAACGVQLIVETHSEHVLNGIRLAIHRGIVSHEDVRLFFFDRSESEGRVNHVVTSPNVDQDGRIDVWPEGFFDEWDRALESLLAPRE